jgi:predicted nucleotidyltransferase
MVQTKEEILTILTEHQEPLRALGVKRLGLFGSFVRDQQTPNSDVDVIVEFMPGKKTFDNFIQLSFLLEDLFQRRIELMTLEALSPHIGPHILKEVEYVALAA